MTGDISLVSMEQALPCSGHCRECWVLVTHLLCSPRLPFQDGLGSLIVLVSHGAGKRGQPLSVSDIQVDVRVRNQQLNDDTMLVADGHMDRRSSFCILQGQGTDFNLQMYNKTQGFKI